MVTDFDCWHPEHDNVDVAGVINIVKQNATTVSRLIRSCSRLFPKERPSCPIGSDRALDNASSNSEPCTVGIPLC